MYKVLCLSFLLAQTLVFSQNQGHRQIHYKSITIINGDTTITEKNITDDGTSGIVPFQEEFGDSNFTFRFYSGIPSDTDDFFAPFRKHFEEMNKYTQDFFKGLPYPKDPFFGDFDFHPFPNPDFFPNKRNYHNRINSLSIEAINENSIENLEVKPDFENKAVIITLQTIDKPISIILLDSQGNILHKETIEKTNGLYSRQLPLTNFSAGTYELQLIQDNKKTAYKVVIN